MRGDQLLTVVGARPQFIKAWPVSSALERRGISEALVHTGQHFDSRMSEVFFDELGIPRPVVNLGVAGGSHGSMTGRMLESLETQIKERTPRAVMVYGDTNSTLAGALAASKLDTPVVHVEAGLRSYNRSMPEEVNRVVTDHLSSLLLCPTRSSARILRNEGIVVGVHVIGDVMFDATLMAKQRVADRGNPAIGLGISGPYAVATVHRAENTDDPERLRKILEMLRACARDRAVVLPMHPRTYHAIEANGHATDGLVICEPMGYLDMVSLVASATLVLTDSGGLQKEAYFHRVPCVTLRAETEWPETIDAGWNRLWDPDNDANDVGAVIAAAEHTETRRDIADFGTGDAAEKVVDLVSGLIDR